MQKIKAFFDTEINDHHIHHAGQAIALFAVMAFLLVSNITVSYAVGSTVLDGQYHKSKTQLVIMEELAYEQSVVLGEGLLAAQSEWQAFDLNESVAVINDALSHELFTWEL